MKTDQSASATSETGAEPAASKRPFDFEDPLSSLPPTAQRLLIAAKEIIAERGFRALTLKAVSDRAGENTAMVSYYFTNKDGLITAVLESVIHDEYLDSRTRMASTPASERPRQLVEEMLRMDSATADFQVFFELLPHVLRHDALRQRMVQLYRWYWKAKLEWLGAANASEELGDQDLLGLAQLLSAVIDGLAIQAAIDHDLDLSNPYRVLQRLLESSESIRVAGGKGGQPAEDAGATERRPVAVANH